MKVEIRAASFESRSASGRSASGRRGDVVEIPDDPKAQSMAERHGLATGNLVAVDLKPVRSTEAPQPAPAEAGLTGPTDAKGRRRRR